MPDVELRRSPLDAVHDALGARMVPFAGWRMPLQYDGIIAEHMAVRERAGLFDVSHMGQLSVDGAADIAALQQHLSNDLSRIASAGEAQYSLLLNDAAGIEDDLIVYRIAADELLLVVNAANASHDAALLDGIAVDVSDRWAMFALQGPLAPEVLASLGIDIADLPAFRFRAVTIAGHDCTLATTGYTGERGCELLVPVAAALDVWNAVLADARVTPCGLGARDTLRLEACYPLHGNDIDAAIDPIAAGLGFAAPAGLHPSVDAIRAAGPTRRLVPVLVDGRGIPRAGSRVLDEAGAQIGEVSSGTMSPVLRAGIALAWVHPDHAAPDTPLAIDVRGTAVPAHVTRRPFVAGSLR
ncbi:MAG: aminomethyltransferase [Thermoleophilia bacterium]|nr:aminomethyltransferase [Thermoleophilia bacterium]